VARRCIYCEKRPVVGNKISHSNIKTKTKHFPNLQKIRAYVDGITRSVYACTRCMRSGVALKPPVRRRPTTETAAVATA